MRDIIDAVLSAWEKAIDLLKKPMGLPVLMGIMLIASYLFANSQRSIGYANAKKDDSLLIAAKNSLIERQEVHLQKITADRDTLQNRLNNYDCAKETEKWNKLFQNLQASILNKKADAEKNLEIERKRTAEIQKTLKSL